MVSFPIFVSNGEEGVKTFLFNAKNQTMEGDSHYDLWLCSYAVRGYYGGYEVRCDFT